MAVIISIKGYWIEIGFLQYLHLPLKKIQLNTGARSNTDSLCLQLTHILRPFIIDNLFLDLVFEF